MRARETAVVADLVRAVRHLDAGDADCLVRGVIGDLGIVRGHDRAVNDVDGERRGDGYVHGAVLVVHGERDRHRRWP